MWILLTAMGGAASYGRSEHLVEHTAAHVGDEVGELTDAHLDSLTEVVGDDDALLGCCRFVDVEFGTPAVALAAERGDMAHVFLR